MTSTKKNKSKTKSNPNPASKMPWPSEIKNQKTGTPPIYRGASSETNSVLSTLKRMERGKLILLSLFLLGIFSLIAGLGLIIASNWSLIPALVKVFGGAIILTGCLYASYLAWEHKKQFLLEIGLFASFLIVGANIGLIQQTYHLNISFKEGALIWSAISLPLLFFTNKPLLMLMWLGLMVFGCWEVIERIFTGRPYIPAGIFFLIFLLSFLFSNKFMEKIRWISLLAMFLVLLAGDLGISTAKESIVGFISTVVALILLAVQKENSKRIDVGFFNVLCLFVTWRIIFLFWTAYYNLFSIGVILLVFGVAILGIASLLYLKKDRWEAFVKGLVNEK